jgi:diadenosine tetraphosphate (Ap4A) HIT family hydrolase
MTFALHPDFLKTSHAIGELSMSQARLEGDARFPWIILVCRLPEARDLDDLSPEGRARLMDEVARAGDAVRKIGEALGRPVAKLNIAALGNVTPQLHVHVIGRRPDDAAWPRPVWGVGAAEPYAPPALETALAAARSALGL